AGGVVGGLGRRRAGAAVLIAVALRPRPRPERLAAALERAHRAAALTRVELRALSLNEAHELLGARIDAVSVAALYEESGGNPFYLEQLARTPKRADGAGSAPSISLSGLEGPPAGAAARSGEAAPPSP